MSLTLLDSLPTPQINWWRLRSLVDSKKSHGDKQTLTIPGDRTHATVSALTPFSEYSLMVMTFNGRGNGPGSHPVNFKTPEGGRLCRKTAQSVLIHIFWGHKSNNSGGNWVAEFDCLLCILPSLPPQSLRKIRFSGSQTHRSTLCLWPGPRRWSLMGFSPDTSWSISWVSISLPLSFVNSDLWLCSVMTPGQQCVPCCAL